jgi:arylamine N-acetyltransferase
MKKWTILFFISLVCVAVILVTGCTSQRSNSAAATTPAPIITATVVVTTTTATPFQTAAPVPSVTTPIPTPTPDPGFETRGSLDKQYYYIVDGTPGFIPMKVYTGVNNYIASLGDIYTGDDYTAVIDNEVQRKYVTKLVENIRRAAKKPDDEARIAISLVQHIKYDANALNEIKINRSKTGQNFIGRYPYTILNQNWGGICGEKSFLLALLLKELGYGVALYEFDDIHHMALGIKAPVQYAYKGTGYALIESTAPEIPTFDEYLLVGTDATLLSTSPSKTVIVSDGKSFTTIETEYADAQVERSIYKALGEVRAAAMVVNDAAEHLDQLRASADYWRIKAQNDFAAGDFNNYQYDNSMFEQAKTAYENYYNQIYNPAYVAWNDLKDEYQNDYAPKQKELEDKYGLTTGTSVGL